MKRRKKNVNDAFNLLRKRLTNRRLFFVYLYKSKRAGIAAEPLLTNPLNSATKLQIGTT